MPTLNQGMHSNARKGSPSQTAQFDERRSVDVAPAVLPRLRGAGVELATACRRASGKIDGASLVELRSLRWTTPQRQDLRLAGSTECGSGGDLRFCLALSTNILPGKVCAFSHRVGALPRAFAQNAACTLTAEAG